MYTCGTRHMASFFSPLQRKTTAAICSLSNLLVATFTQHLASHPTSHSDQKGLTPLLALLLVSIRDALLTTYTWLPSHLSVDSHHEYLMLPHTHQIILNSENFYCRNGDLATDIISTASSPHQRCQHPTKGALLLAQAKRTRTFLALLLITVRRLLLTTSSPLPGQVLTRLSLGISPLAST